MRLRRVLLGRSRYREIAAVWIVRVLDGGDDEVDSVGSRFSDVDPGGEWAAHIERLAELGVTLGCAAEPARFCPHYTATRSQVASFLARAFELGSAEPAGFGDTAGSVHETNINALYAAGITTGCSTDPLLFCPRDPTTRAQMASFLNRARTLDTGTDDSDETGSSSSGGGGGGGTVVVEPVDVEGASVHAAAVRELHGLGVLAGTECASGGFCWGDPVTREIASVWIVRVLDGGDDEVDSVGSRFSDVDPGGEWAAHIERLAELGVTLGCAAEPARFCPHYTATRSQVASFLARAFELGSAEPAGFGDTAGSVHETNIDALYAAGITTGCSTDPLLFCPRDPTTRAQMARFLNRVRTLDTGTDDSDETGSSSSAGGTVV